MVVGDGALKKYIRESDPVTGAIGGPIRVVYGLQTLRAAEKPTEYVEGVDQVAAGTLTAVSGAIGFSGVGAAVATDAGLPHVTRGLQATVKALGGPAVGGWLGGAAAVLKGGTDLVHGITQHDQKLAAVGSAKLAASGLMLAGAASMNPLLVAAGSAVYLTTCVLASHQHMTRTEMGAAAALIGGAAIANPFLVAGGTLCYLGAALVRNRQVLAAWLQQHHLARRGTLRRTLDGRHDAELTK